MNIKKIIVGLLIVFFITGGRKLDAKVANYIVMDANSKLVLKGNNINEQFLTASICKVLTAIIVLENCDIDEEIIVTPKDLQVTGSSVYLTVGEKITYRSLIYGLMLRSGNDCALTLANHAFGNYDYFILMMNDYAKRLKMTNSSFNNPSGLDEDTTNYSTLYDMALLSAYCSYNKEFIMINQTKRYAVKTNEKNYLWQNKHRLILNNPYVIGGKTGFTKKAGRTLITMAQKDDKQIVCVSFKIGDDFNLHNNLINDVLNSYQKTRVLRKGIYRNDLNLEYFTYLENDLYYLLPKKNEIEIVFFLFETPKNDGVCGYISIKINDFTIKEQLKSYNHK